MKINATLNLPDNVMEKLSKLYEQSIDEGTAFDDEDVIEYVLKHVAKHGLNDAKTSKPKNTDNQTDMFGLPVDKSSGQKNMFDTDDSQENIFKNF